MVGDIKVGDVIPGLVLLERVTSEARVFADKGKVIVELSRTIRVPDSTLGFLEKLGWQVDESNNTFVKEMPKG